MQTLIIKSVNLDVEFIEFVSEWTEADREQQGPLGRPSGQSWSECSQQQQKKKEKVINKLGVENENTCFFYH